METNLRKIYFEKVVPRMMKEFNLKNIYQCPKIEKVVINTSFGKLIADKSSKEEEKIIDSISKDLALISGQKPVLIKSKKAISAFKLKKGKIIAAKVTLRKKRLYDFLERLIYIALPRLHDFQGIPESCFDESGNLTIGIPEQTAFPEVKVEKEKNIFSLEVTITTNTKNKKASIRLFQLLGFPIKSK